MKRRGPDHVVLAGGGTAGHIEPALNLAAELRSRNPDVGITALGTTGGLEVDMVPARGYDLELIPAAPLPRRPSWDVLRLPGRLRRAASETHGILTSIDADVVVGFGGYVSVPAYVAAKRNRTPFVVHEANAKPGLANRLGARFTPFVAESYAGTLRGAVRLGCPLRSAISHLDRPAARAEALELFGLDPDLRTLLVFGGSQGARRINDAVRLALPELLAAGVQVLHAVGARNVVEEPRAGYYPVAFIERMDAAYAVADLAVCRAGAMTCAELAAVGLPAVYVPYAAGNGEQRLNAEPVVRAGGGLLIPDSEIDSDSLCGACLPLISDPERLGDMSARASAYGIRDAAARLADLVEQAVASR